MTINNRKDLTLYLKSYEYIRNELEELEKSQLPGSPQFSNVPGCSSHKSKSSVYNKMISHKDELIEQMREIEKLVDSIGDPIAHTIVWMKFIGLYSLDSIATIQNKSLPTIKKHYKKGMDELLLKYLGSDLNLL